jgi:hypothetical protein
MSPSSSSSFGILFGNMGCMWALEIRDEKLWGFSKQPAVEGTDENPAPRVRESNRVVVWSRCVRFIGRKRKCVCAMIVCVCAYL